MKDTRKPTSQKKHLRVVRPRKGQPIAETKNVKRMTPLKDFMLGLKKLFRRTWKHPRWTLGILLTGMACTFLCSYFGFTILAGMGMWAVYQES